MKREIPADENVDSEAKDQIEGYTVSHTVGVSPPPPSLSL